MLSITPGLTGNVITSVKQSLLENKKEPENKRMSPVQNYRFTFMNLGPTLSSQCGTSLHTSVFYNAIYASSSTYPIIQNSTQTGEDELLHLLLCFLISLISIHCAGEGLVQRSSLFSASPLGCLHNTLFSQRT